MTAENQTIEVYEDDAFRRTFDVTEGGSTKNLTGATAEWSVAREAGGTAVLDETDAGVDVTITDAGNGEVTLTVDPGTTTGLSGDYIHELEVTDSSGNSVTVSRGRFTVTTDTA